MRDPSLDPDAPRPAGEPNDPPDDPPRDPDETAVLPTAEAAARTAAFVDLTGKTVDRYRILRRIGYGGMGTVYEARDETLERNVALKVISAPAIDDHTRTRFLSEARAAAALNHPRIVSLYDAGEADGMPFLVMELVDGENLSDAPPRDLEEALEIASQICRALAHAHDHGLVHRDLKPGNVLVTRANGKTSAKLTDMGIALTRGSARVTHSGAVAGTPAYMAPEQALGGEIDARTDLYALGVLLYEWTAGRLPFTGDNALEVISQHIHAPVVPPGAFRRDLPPGLDPLIVKLLAKDPDARYGSAQEVRDALERIRAAGQDATALDTGPEIAIEGLVRGRMVGRSAELATVHALWRAALAGKCHLALISGEPGIGKTRLAREVIAAARVDGARVLSGGCFENEATTPYLPFVEALRNWVRDRTDETLRETLGDTAAELARLAPEIESRLGPFPPRAALEPQEERLRLFDHFARFLRNVAGTRGLLFFFDDLQWADHGSLALMHYLLRQLASDRVFFLGAYREVELDRAHPLARHLVDWNRQRLATRVQLRRLDLDGTAHMLGTLLGEEEVPRPFIDSLHRETEGNPFFVEEIVKTLIAEGELVRRDCCWRWDSDTGDIALPQSVKAAIGSRLSGIGETCAGVLRTAAVLGKRFDFTELSAVADLSEDELLDALDEAVRAQLLGALRGEAFAFTHDKIREVLYDELNPIRRRRIHARVATGLEALRDRGGAVSVEDLAHHFMESGDDEHGLRYGVEAATAASRVFAYDEARTLLGRARECAEALDRPADLVDIDEALGDAALNEGDIIAATSFYERALTEVTDARQRNSIRAKAAEAYANPGDPRGLELVEAALAEIDAESDPEIAAHALMMKARYLHLEAKLEPALETYLEALPIAERTGDRDLIARLYSYVSGTYQHLADFENSDRYAHRSIEIGVEHRIPHGSLLGHEFLSENALYRGYWDACVEHGEIEERLALETHARERFCWSLFRAWALHPLGRLDEAEALCRRAIAESEQIGEKRLELFMRIALGAIDLDRGRADEAEERLRDAFRESEERELVAHHITSGSILTRILVRTGRPREALETARLVAGLWSKTGSAGTFLINGADVAEGLLAGGDVEAATTLLDDHARLAERTASDYRLGLNLRVRGLAAVDAGRHGDALAAFDDSAEKLAATKSPLDLARTLSDRSALHRETGCSDDSERDAAEARRLLESHGAATTGIPPA